MKTSISCLFTALACPLFVGCYGPDAAGDVADESSSGGADESSDGGDMPEDPTSANPTAEGGDESDSGNDEGSDGDVPDPTDGESGEIEDTTPPTLVQSSPADGEAGVVSDAQIRLQFSEPMDKASVQTAYQSQDLPDVFLTMSWNDAGDELTLTPSFMLDYGHGTSPDDVTPRSYSVSITTAATDLAGNELEADAVITFTTLNLIEQEMPIVAALAGAVRQDGDSYPGFIMAGDAGVPANARWKGFVSFSLDSLPEALVAVVEAELLCTQIDVSGAPYEDLGALEIHDIAFEALDLVAFDALSERAVVTSDETALGQGAFDVTAAVTDDLGSESGLTQFRFEFPLASDFDAAYDYAMFASTDPSPVLRIQYLMP